MSIRRRDLVIALLASVVIAGAFVAVRRDAPPPASGRPATITSAQAQDLLAAIVREVRDKFIAPEIAEDRLYAGAAKGLLEAAGPACARAATGGGAASVRSRDEYAVLASRVEQRCTNPPPDAAVLTYGAAKRMLEALDDPYTRFMEPRAFQEFHQDAQGFFFGIGIFIDIKDDRLIVVQPIPGTPAARAGLRAGDHIAAIDGVSTAGMALQEAVVRIRGRKGTRVTLQVGRGDRAFTTTIVRDRIEIAAGEGMESLDAATQEQLRQAGIGYIKLVTFNDNTDDVFGRLLEQVRRSGARAVILDLRNNGGGLLDVSLRVAGRFVPAGQPIVHTVDRNGKRQSERAGRGAKVNLPVIVLVNEFTASASEIVSGALQDHEVAQLVGVKTFGKGVIQTVVDLPLGSGAAITTAKYLTPDGRDIHGKGLLPDVPVGETDEALRARLKGRPESVVEQRVGEMTAAQLQRAVDLLRQRIRGLLVPVRSAAA